ncbi:MAG: hydrogenase formation protein HypD [bacterium]
MKRLDYNNPKIAKSLIDEIYSFSSRDIIIMEFCGTHTHSIFRFGIRELLPKNISMLSGPGCPVCVTDTRDIDYCIALSSLPDVIITTFGDMIRVPGSSKSLQEVKAEGADVRIVYSSMDAINVARENPKKKVVFLGVGFETTAPTVASSIIEAEKNNIDNYFVYSMHKLTPPAMEAILNLGEIRLNGILGPGHVSTVIGWKAWEFVPLRYRLPVVVAGFDAVDILLGILNIVKLCSGDKLEVVNAYQRAVKPYGNSYALSLMNEVFERDDALWRGLGELPQSGLQIKNKYKRFDARLEFPFDIPSKPKPKGCRCDEVIRGVISPLECSLFGIACTPSHPVGPCMVSSEGTCSAYYIYGGK